MKNKLLSVLSFILLPLTLLSCGQKPTVAEAIFQIGYSTEAVDYSEKYDLDSRFKCFQMFQVGGDSTLHLNKETGLVSLYFTVTENEDGSALCSLTGIYLIDVGNIAFGQVSKEKLSTYIGEDQTFTLVLKDNVVTTHDLPELLDIYKE